MPGSERAGSAAARQGQDGELLEALPEGIEYGLHYDTTRFVRRPKRDVIITLSEALALVILSSYLFAERRTTLIPTIVFRFRLIATLAVMQVMGFSLEHAEPARHGAGDRAGLDDAIVGGGERRTATRKRSPAN